MRCGPYEIVSLLGEGSSGQVYRAWDPRLEREVALKVLRQRSETDPARVRRFIGEARAASALNHPNIVTVFDAAVDGDTPFIVSELVDGKSLREELGRGSIPIKRTLDLATQIADGLSAAHAAGIVHRDLKPDNIMVTRAGRAKIVDFGLARPGGFERHDPVAAEIEPSANERTQTELGLRAGTIPYMSPEQARGSTTGFRSDQFSFGLILFEMVSGRPAFRRETPAATLDAIINDEPPLAALDPRMPLQLRWIIERCLAKDPEERYGVTGDLHRDLRTLRDRLSEVAAREATTAASAPATVWRRGLIVTAAGLIAAVAAIMVLSNRATTEPSPMDLAALRFTPLATENVYEGFPAWSPDGQHIAYVAERDGTLQIFTRRLGSPEPAAQVTHEQYDCRYPFWSPDSRRIYYISRARRRDAIWSISTAGGRPQVAIEDAMRGAMSPDGRTIAFLRDESPNDIVSAASLWSSTRVGSETWSSGPGEGATTKYERLGNVRFVEGFLAFSPDGAKLGLSAVTRAVDVEPDRRGWQLWILPLPAGQPYRRLQWWPDPAPRTASFTWLPDSRRIVVSLTSITTPGSDLWMADVVDDRAWPLTRSPDPEDDPSASPDGDQVVFTRGESDYDLVEVPLSGGAPTPMVASVRNESDPAWSADGNLLAYVTDRRGQQEIWLRSREGEEWLDRPLITQQEFGDDLTILLSAPTFSPDGRRIAYQRNARKPIWPLRIWISLTAAGAPTPLLPPSYEGYQSAPSWSPDGEWIAFTDWKDGPWKLAIVRVLSGETPIVLRTDGLPDASPHWSPRNDWITWETDEGLLLVSPDGQRARKLTEEQLIVHTWSKDGSEILGITEVGNRLKLVSFDTRHIDDARGPVQARELADLGPSIPVNNQVKGLSVAPGGRFAATSMLNRLQGDLSLLGGLQLAARGSRRRRMSWFP
jgi:Tol biopolymer transport system component